MSATVADVIEGRARIPRDAYFTPDPLAFAIVARLADTIPTPRRILDPSCGGAAFLRAARGPWAGAKRIGVDISQTAAMFAMATGAEFACADFLRWECAEPFDLILGNPPYNDAEAHVWAALRHLRDGGMVAFLLRLSFLASKQRMRGVCSGPGRAVTPISPRPSFTGTGNDNSEYALFTWTKNATTTPTMGEPLFWKKA